MPTVEFKFSGKIASEGVLDFYESARFQYGAARFLYTLDSFKKHGEIPKRITRNVADTHFRVSTPIKGSWEIVVQEILQTGASTFISVPLGMVIQYAISLILPTKRQAESLQSDHARAIIEEHNKPIMKLIDEIARKSASDHDVSIEYINHLKEELKNRDKALDLNSEIIEKLNSLVERMDRHASIGSDYQAFSEVSSEKKFDLINKIRPQMYEIGIPLRKSADNLTIISEDEKSKKSDNITIVDIEGLSGNTIDTNKSIIAGSLKRYDKENGWGKIRETSSSKIVNFLVRKNEKRKLLTEILDAMESDKVIISGFYVRDPSGAPTYLIFDSYIGNPDDD
ncbi:hypothetical protein ACFELO_03355 [Oceanicaulis sp. LC35]|uniref:DUF7946 domain-containing protein n=1 Tax=Oceanicaulis sp. LC35 TaxID=3349635 RepID=UPI003F87CA08